VTVIRRDGLSWVAARDGLAHADPHGTSLRTLCGKTPTPDRYAWPIREFCAVCSTIAEAMTAQDRVAARAKTDPGYRQMLIEDTRLAAEHDAEGAA
jgi:hypothetical protein